MLAGHGLSKVDIVPLPSSVMQTNEAVAAAIQLMEQPEFAWAGRPQPVLVEQRGYGDAICRIGNVDRDFSRWSPETSMWVRIPGGQWDLMPIGAPGATLTLSRFDGCLFVLVSAQDRGFMGAGDPRCP